MEDPNRGFQKTLTYFIELETLAQDIQTLRELKLELSNTENKLREAFRALQASDDRKSFLKIGSLFVKKPTVECKKLIVEEMDRIKMEYEGVSKDLRDKLSKLRDLEHQPRIEGIGLKPLSGFEAKAITKAFGYQ